MTNLIEGMDNSVVIVFLIIMGFILFIFWNILNLIMETKTRRQVDPYSINNLGGGAIPNQVINDPYLHTAENEDCSICTERIKFKVELDCTHKFCGKCIMDYHESIRPSDLKCPLCRAHVRIINYENITRSLENREWYDKIVKFNHRNLTGTNYVNI